MNEHLLLVRAFHEELLYSQAEVGATERLSDMEIIRYQALLMEAGGEILKAIKIGEMAEILLGLVDLAYVALAAIARQGGQVAVQPIFWRQDGYVLSMMQIISAKIAQCASGETVSYSDVYCLCNHLARSFVNADFNKAFVTVHKNRIARVKISGDSIYDDSDAIRKTKLQKSPDLGDCLYE